MDPPATWALLRELDDPERVEYPADYQEAALQSRFERLLADVEHTFRAVCRAGTRASGWVQDSSRFGSIVIPAGAVEGDAPVEVQVSAFGNLATYGPRQTGAAPGPPLADDDRDRIAELLRTHGYVAVPEEAWGQPYDGRNPRVAAEGVTWAERFFGDFLV